MASVSVGEMATGFAVILSATRITLESPEEVPQEADQSGFGGVVTQAAG